PQAHRVPASRADATDPSAIDDAVRTAVAAIRGGGGPRFVLAQTAPWPGNATFLPTNPLGRVELSRAERPDHEWDAHDPILNEVRALRRDGADPEALRTLDARVAAEVEDALRAALDAPPAPASVAFENVRASA